LFGFEKRPEAGDRARVARVREVVAGRADVRVARGGERGAEAIARASAARDPRPVLAVRRAGVGGPRAREVQTRDRPGVRARSHVVVRRADERAPLQRSDHLAEPIVHRDGAGRGRRAARDHLDERRHAARSDRVVVDRAGAGAPTDVTAGPADPDVDGRIHARAVRERRSGFCSPSPTRSVLCQAVERKRLRSAGSGV
jgi:hypothetical protein